MTDSGTQAGNFGPTPSITPPTMLVSFVHGGDTVTYYNNSANTLPAGTPIVQADLVGIPTSPIPPYSYGALIIEGAFRFPKSTAGESGRAAGTKMYWDATNQTAVHSQQTAGNAGPNCYLGKLETATADSDTTCVVQVEAIANG